MESKRIGVFGGTFDPPHIGHMILATEARHNLQLDRLLWILTPIPPHKLEQRITPQEHRLAMLELTLANEPDFELSRIELERPGPHYTVDTLGLLSKAHPFADLILIIGGDSLRELPTWRHPVNLVSACKQIGVIRRPGDSIDLSEVENLVPGTQTKVRFVEAPLLDISSTDIRRRIREKLPFRYFLSSAVYNYIQKNELYR